MTSKNCTFVREYETREGTLKYFYIIRQFRIYTSEYSYERKTYQTQFIKKVVLYSMFPFMLTITFLLRFL